MIALLILARWSSQEWSHPNRYYATKAQIIGRLTTEMLGVRTGHNDAYGDYASMVELGDPDPTSKLCTYTKAHKAAHLSHHAMDEAFGHMPAHIAHRLNRGLWMKIVYYNWQYHCLTGPLASQVNVAYSKHQVQCLQASVLIEESTCDSGQEAGKTTAETPRVQIPACWKV
jgi:hypothetical protein